MTTTAQTVALAIVKHAHVELAKRIESVALGKAVLVYEPLEGSWWESAFYLYDTALVAITEGRAGEVKPVQGAIEALADHFTEAVRFVDLSQMAKAEERDDVIALAWSDRGLSVMLDVHREHMRWRWSLSAAGRKA